MRILVVEDEPRLRALLRRQAPRKDGVLKVGAVTFDPATGAVARGGRDTSEEAG